MNAVFALDNRASAEDVRAKLTAPPSDSSVRVMLARLERKGFLRHQQDGLRYIYSDTMSPAVASAGRSNTAHVLLRFAQTVMTASARWIVEDETSRR